MKLHEMAAWGDMGSVPLVKVGSLITIPADSHYSTHPGHRTHQHMSGIFVQLLCTCLGLPPFDLEL